MGLYLATYPIQQCDGNQLECIVRFVTTVGREVYEVTGKEKVGDEDQVTQPFNVDSINDHQTKM